MFNIFHAPAGVLLYKEQPSRRSIKVDVGFWSGPACSVTCPHSALPGAIKSSLSATLLSPGGKLCQAIHEGRLLQTDSLANVLWMWCRPTRFIHLHLQKKKKKKKKKEGKKERKKEHDDACRWWWSKIQQTNPTLLKRLMMTMTMMMVMKRMVINNNK